MNGLDALLYLRYAEILLLLYAIQWVVWSQPPSAYRTRRLLIAFALLTLNVGAIMIRVFWLRLPPW